jgi:hypothetical protein
MHNHSLSLSYIFPRVDRSEKRSGQRGEAGRNATRPLLSRAEVHLRKEEQELVMRVLLPLKGYIQDPSVSCFAAALRLFSDRRCVYE